MRVLKFRIFLIFTMFAFTGCSSHQNSMGLDTAAQIKDDRELAQLALQSDRPQSAITIYRQQLLTQPDDPALLLALGIAYNQLGEFDLALHYLDKAHALLSDDASSELGRVFREKGQAKQGLGQAEAALLDLTQAAELLPHDAKTMNSLGINYALCQDYPNARQAFIGALANEPGNMEYRNNLALAWILDGNPQQGIDVLYAHYLRGSSTVRSRQNLALAFAMKGDIAAAKTIAKQDLSKVELDNNLAYYQQLGEVAQ